MLNRERQTEQGFVSIVVALTIITVLALITVGFTQLSRREQQNALNKQLNTQAYYAAETGISDAKQLIDKGKITSSTANTDGNHCIDLSAFSISGTNFTNDVNSGNGVYYSCVLVNMQPDSVVYSTVDPGVNKSTTFSTPGGTDIASLDIFWKTNNAVANPPATSDGEDFPNLNTWKANSWPAVIEIKVVPLTGSFDQQQVINNTFTAYLYPSLGGSGSAAFARNTAAGIGSQAPIITGNCNSGGCNSHITGIDTGVPGANYYLISLHTYYTAADTIVITPRDSAGNKTKTVGGQIVIDVTGKAQDVLKRLQVHIPAKENESIGNFAIEATNICKRIQTTPGSTQYITATSSSAAGVGDPCNLKN